MKSNERISPGQESAARRKVQAGLAAARRLLSLQSKNKLSIGRQRQLQMFGQETLDYAEQHPASQIKIQEFIKVAETLAIEKEKNIKGGSATRTMVVKDENEKTTDAITVEYNRSGSLAQAAVQERIDSPVAAVKGLGFDFRRFEPGELAGFGPKFARVWDDIEVYESGEPEAPYRILYKRRAEDMSGQMFSEFLHDGADESQSVVVSERPATDIDIEHAILTMMAAANSDQSETTSG